VIFVCRIIRIICFACGSGDGAAGGGAVTRAGTDDAGAREPELVV